LFCPDSVIPALLVSGRNHISDRILEKGKYLKITSLLGVSLALLSANTLSAQEVKTTTSHSSAGGTVVRVETTLSQSPQEVWRWFATEKGLQCWAAPLIRLDLRIGGKLETNYNAKASIGGPGTITLGIVNFVEAEFLTFKVKLNDAFSEVLQAEDDNLQEVIRLERLPNGGTRIVSTMIGWGSGADWDRAAEFFAKGNEASYKDLAKCAVGAQTATK
jgi:uncharacterized protein YndB with AHSA1/START domain